MAAPIMSHEKAKSISSGIFLVSLGILFFTGAWWPGILLAIGTSLAVKELLRGRYYDLLLTLVLFGGLFAVLRIEGGFSYIAAVFLTLGGITLIFRELFLPKTRSTKDEVIDVSVELKNEEKKDE